MIFFVSNLTYFFSTSWSVSIAQKKPCTHTHVTDKSHTCGWKFNRFFFFFLLCVDLQFILTVPSFPLVFFFTSGKGLRGRRNCVFVGDFETDLSVRCTPTHRRAINCDEFSWSRNGNRLRRLAGRHSYRAISRNKLKLNNARTQASVSFGPALTGGVLFSKELIVPKMRRFFEITFYYRADIGHFGSDFFPKRGIV